MYKLDFNILMIGFEEAGLIKEIAKRKEMDCTFFWLDDMKEKAVEMICRGDVQMVVVNYEKAGGGINDLQQLIRECAYGEKRPVIIYGEEKSMAVLRSIDFGSTSVDIIPKPVYGHLLKNKILYYADVKRKAEQVNVELYRITNELDRKFRKLFQLLPNGVAIINGDVVQFANRAFARIFDVSRVELVEGRRLGEFIRKGFGKVYLYGLDKGVWYETSVETGAGRQVFLKVMVADYELEEGTRQVYVQDITDETIQMRRASALQRKRIDMHFPLSAYAMTEVIYQPAEVIGGDVFNILRVNEHEVIGFIADVQGHGISAALATSGIRVLFADQAQRTTNPREILENINSEHPKYFNEEEMTAALCFHMDFRTRRMTVSSAGISSYIISRRSTVTEYNPKSHFLGMFEKGSFTETIHDMEKKDCIFFYTDGCDPFIASFKDQLAKGIHRRLDHDRAYVMEKIRNIRKSPKSGCDDDCTMMLLKVLDFFPGSEA